MRPADDNMFRHWLEAERRGEEPAAEAALRGLMLALPSPAPRPGFAERVMTVAVETAFVQTAAVRVQAFGWPLRALVAACLLFTGCAVALAPRVAALFADMITLGEALSASIRALTLLVDAVVTLMSLGEILGGLHDAFVRVVTSPAMLLVWLGAILFSLLHLRWLTQLLALSPRGDQGGETQSPRSSGYVSAH